MRDSARLLSILRDDSAPQPAPGEVPETPGQLEPKRGPVALRGAEMTRRDQAWAAVRYAFRAARFRVKALQAREGGLVNGLLAGKPPSVLEQDEYARSRAWVPPGHEGGLADKSGTVYHALIGRPGVAFFGACSAICARPFRFIPAFLIFVVCAVVLAVWFGLI